MRKEKLEKVLKALREGLKLGDILLRSGEPKGGRFVEELNLDIYAFRKDSRLSLLYVKIFTGRAHYRDWIEIFGISREVFGRNYFGSELEGKVLDLFCPLTGRIFVEYFEDKETVRELSAGVPPALSRLGFELAKRGFTWFKDWYFPEGLMEGGHKLQAEKPSSDEWRERHVKKIEEGLRKFLKTGAEEILKERALERFKILESQWKKS